MHELSDAQVRFFDTFGFLVVRGLLADDLDWIRDEFTANFDAFEVDHDGSVRSAIIPFIDHRPRLRALLEHPGIDCAFTSLLGADWSFLSSDGNLFTGGTPWHPDVTMKNVTFAKMAIYLDPVTASTGALRVIPGSHRLDGPNVFAYAVREGAKTTADRWGVEPEDVPSVALDSLPGDVTIINENIVHGSWGGSTKRRQFTINAFSSVGTPEEAQDLRDVIAIHGQMWMERMFADDMVETAPPGRRRRLAAVLEHQDHLAALAAEARQTMEAPIMQNRGWHAPTRVS